MSAESWEESLSLGDTIGRIQTRRERDGMVWYSGDVLTPWGIVAAYSDSSHTRYDFAHGHRLYSRYERRSRTPRGIAVQATKFARRIISEQE